MSLCFNFCPSLTLTSAGAFGAHLDTSEGGKECQHPGHCHRRWSQHSAAVATNCHNPGESGKEQNEADWAYLHSTLPFLTCGFILMYALLVLFAVFIRSSQLCCFTWLCPWCFPWFLCAVFDSLCYHQAPGLQVGFVILGGFIWIHAAAELTLRFLLILVNVVGLTRLQHKRSCFTFMGDYTSLICLS